MDSPNSAVCIHTERLALREIDTDADFWDILSYVGDNGVVQYMEWGPYDENGLKRFLSDVALNVVATPRLAYDLAVTRGGRLIGDCGIYQNAVRTEAMISYVLRREAWGKGYATEIVGALLNYSFTELKLRRVYALVAADNHASVRVLEKNRFRREGHFKENQLVKGRWRDSFHYAILQKEWYASITPRPVLKLL